MPYLKLWNICALHIDVSQKLGIQPLFAIVSCQGEYIFDMPYCRIIFTPAAKLKNTLRTSCHETKDASASTDPAGTTEY